MINIRISQRRTLQLCYISLHYMYHCWAILQVINSCAAAEDNITQSGSG